MEFGCIKNPIDNLQTVATMQFEQENSVPDVFDNQFDPTNEENNLSWSTCL